MKVSKQMAEWTVLALLLAGGGGCVAFPVGRQEFSTEYSGEIRATEEAPSKEYEPSVAAAPGAGGSVDLGLSAEITTRQARRQHWERVTLTKRKILAAGLWTEWAETLCTYMRPKDALVPTRDLYLGGGQYGDGAPSVDYGAFEAGRILNLLTLTLLAAPLDFVHGLCGPFEHEWHYLGRTVENKRSRDEHGTVHINKVHSSLDLDLLAKFPEEERRRIGAWTWRDNDEHPQDSFWHGVTFVTLLPWPGVSKYCTYVVHEPVELDRTTPAEPETKVERKAVAGPYGVFLQIPEEGFSRTLAVPRGETAVRFELPQAEHGRADAQAWVRFLPPAGGLDEAWDDDARAVLEAVSGADFPVSIQLPLPRLAARAGGK